MTDSVDFNANYTGGSFDAVLREFAGFTTAAIAAYPNAERARVAWNATHASNAAGGVDFVAMLPWLPWLTMFDKFLSLSMPEGLALPPNFAQFPNPGPGGFNFGPHARFWFTGYDFAGPDWQGVVYRAGGDPNATYFSGTVQNPRAGSDGRDYLQCLWIRSGEFLRPVAAYPSRRPSGWVEFRDEALKPGLALMLAATGVGAALAGTVGSSIMGATFTAANPILTQAIGQTVIRVAVNGGDLGGALKGQAFSFAGGQIGAQLGALADSPMVGTVSTAALTAAFNGGDPRVAVAQSLLTTGAKNLGDFLNTPATTGETPMLADAWAADPATDTTAIDFAAPASGNSWDAFDWSVTPSVNATDYANFGTDTASTSAWPTTAPSQPTSTPSGGWVADVTNLALAALKIDAAYKAMNAPQPRTLTQAGTITYTPRADGTVLARNTATGQTAVQRPATGTPYVLPDGSIIVNQGNGTYSYIDPNGNTSTRAYSAASAPGASTSGGALATLSTIPPAVWGIGAALLLFALKSRRRA